MKFFDIKKSLRSKYTEYCLDEFGTPSYYKNKCGVIFEDGNPHDFEPIYSNLNFDNIYPTFKQHFREERISKIL